MLGVDPSILLESGLDETTEPVSKEDVGQQVGSETKTSLSTAERWSTDHIKSMTELFNEMAIVGDAIDEEVYLLASLPDSFNTLVTANEDVPKMVAAFWEKAERQNKCRF